MFARAAARPGDSREAPPTGRHLQGRIGAPHASASTGCRALPGDLSTSVQGSSGRTSRKLRWHAADETGGCVRRWWILPGVWESPARRLRPRADRGDQPDASASCQPRAVTPTTTWCASTTPSATARGPPTSASSAGSAASADIRSHLLAQDLIYVGGGSLVCLLGVWRAHGIDSILRHAYEAGVILCGLSAGSLCWFAEAVSGYHGEVNRVPALGFLRHTNAVHYGDGDRRGASIAISWRDAGGYAAEDGAALRFVGDELVEVVASRPSPAPTSWSDGEPDPRDRLATRYLGAEAPATVSRLSAGSARRHGASSPSAATISTAGPVTTRLRPDVELAESPVLGSACCPRRGRPRGSDRPLPEGFRRARLCAEVVSLFRLAKIRSISARSCFPRT